MQLQEQGTLHGTVSDQGNVVFSDKYPNEDKPKTELIETVQIEETPFTAVRVDEKWMLCMGKYRLSEGLESLEQCKALSEDTSWDMLLKVMNIVAMVAIDVDKEISNLKN